MDKVVDFYQMLIGKVREDTPDLNLVMLLYDTPSWYRCCWAAKGHLTKVFADHAKPVSEMLGATDRFEASLSAYYPQRIKTKVGGAESTAVFQINLDQAAFLQTGDPLVITKGIMAHETAHAVSCHKRNGYDYWQLCDEEGLADIFSCAVMANLGHPEYLQNIMDCRLCSDDRPGVLAISSTEHSFPALVEPAAALIAEYGSKRPGDFSVTALRREAEQIVRENRSLLMEWRHFAAAAMTLADKGYGAGEVLALARAAGSPFARTVEAFSDFRIAGGALGSTRNPFNYEARDPDCRIERAVDPAVVRKLTHSKRWFGYIVMHNDALVASERRSL